MQAKRRSDGTLYTLREQLGWDLPDFRILSIDGGGIKGILPAKVLAECEKRFTGGRSAGSFFDMIAGTSTGGIIALGLGIGLTSDEILSIYLNHGSEIFPPKLFAHWKYLAKIEGVLGTLRNTQRYRYEREPLARHLRDTFRRSIIGNSTRRLVIPTFDQFTEVNLIKTPHHQDYRMDWKERMVSIALATSAAPTFFPVYKKGDRYFADGGVWANNPIMNALVDALACYRIERRQIRILSLGCGDQSIEFSDSQMRHGGIWHWREIISSAMHLQSQNAIGQSGLLIGRDRLLRLNAPVTATPIEMDDYERAADELPSAAIRIVEENEEQLRAFFSEIRPIYKAFHGPRCESGV